jgi:hemolysin III
MVQKPAFGFINFVYRAPFFFLECHAMSEMITNQKPLLRGHFHQAAFFFALGASGVLIAAAHEPRVRMAAIIYGFSLAGLFGISTIYHRPHWQPEVRSWLRRLDHSAIYVLIAGTATPVCLIGMANDTGGRLLWFIWVAAAAGIIKTLFWVNSPRMLTAALYVGIGCLTVPFVSEMEAALGWGKLSLIVLGGVIYAMGALVYATKWPNPIPSVFGYHEVFHVLVVIASLLHFIVIYQLVHTI